MITILLDYSYRLCNLLIGDEGTKHRYRLATKIQAPPD